MNQVYSQDLKFLNIEFFFWKGYYVILYFTKVKSNSYLIFLCDNFNDFENNREY